MPEFTVIVPTHDHADTLFYSVQSVLDQTVRDLDVIIVGDGAPERTAEIAAALAQRDSRVRYQSFPKGERHGEASRHLVLQDVCSQYVCYQADDDLWFPDHLETMRGCLRAADFAHTMSVHLLPGGDVSTWLFDAKIDPWALSRIHRGEQATIGLANGGHTMEAYRRLPHGWRPAPPGIASDGYFWLQFLENSDFSYASHKWPTTLHLSSLERRGWPLDRRVEELAAVAVQASNPVWRGAMTRRALVPVHDDILRRLNRDAVSRAFTMHAITQREDETLGTVVRQYRPGERLDFSLDDKSSNPAFGLYPEDGLYPPEPFGRWVRRPEISLVLPVDALGEGDLNFSFEVVHFLSPGVRDSSRFRLTLEGRLLLDVGETQEAHKTYCSVIPSYLHRGRAFLSLRLVVANPIAPADAGLGSDKRKLSIGVRALTISPI